ncbi:hypothetical protein B0H67DRAFT_566689 [Lasiosphaeris hirsuta]|uniref:Azaphilone pigments biosynthesis cluster protein L N-terminal domain-containing protein n=1 Tax=Lasiosphaeris hirsuta TaxID=260670 RepID=A0AA40BD73_9PEZI|nr:hypothetical protein B0H67DRAFT_566689 [Lasiosphaeris hirsuta]
MADPLSVGVSVLAIVTAAIKSVKSLAATTERYKKRDKTLIRLHHELEDVVNVLDSLKEVIDYDATILAVLKGPVDRCGQVCHEFEKAMVKFSGNSKTGLRDWAKMEFARDDINGFMDALSSYKATILVGLGTITMRNSNLTQQALESYGEMIKDTSYNLEIRLQRIEAFVTTDDTADHSMAVDWRDEREVTKECIRICEDAQSYMESLQSRKPHLRQDTTSALPDAVHNQFEAELKTVEALNKNRDNLLQTIGFLQQRLVSIISNESPERSRQEAQFRKDLDISKQCLEVCKEAGEQVRFRKIHLFGEVVADDDNDQVVVATLADLFDVRKVLAKNRTFQTVGSMSGETAEKLCEGRYRSRLGAVGEDIKRTSPSKPDTQEDHAQRANSLAEGREPASVETGRKPSPNEVRKRTAESEEAVPKVGR